MENGEWKIGNVELGMENVEWKMLSVKRAANKDRKKADSIVC